MEDDFFSDLLSNHNLPKPAPPPGPLGPGHSKHSTGAASTATPVAESQSQPADLVSLSDKNDNNTEDGPKAVQRPAQSEQTPCLSCMSRADVEAVLQKQIESALDRTFGKLLNGVKAVLGDFSSRLGNVEKEVSSVKESLAQQPDTLSNLHENMHARFTKLDEAVLEVHRGVQAMRDKQELIETQFTLMKVLGCTEGPNKEGRRVHKAFEAADVAKLQSTEGDSPRSAASAPAHASALADAPQTAFAQSKPAPTLASAASAEQQAPAAAQAPPAPQAPAVPQAPPAPQAQPYATAPQVPHAPPAHAQQQQPYVPQQPYTAPPSVERQPSHSSAPPAPPQQPYHPAPHEQYNYPPAPPPSQPTAVPPPRGPPAPYQDYAPPPAAGVPQMGYPSHAPPPPHMPPPPGQAPPYQPMHMPPPQVPPPVFGQQPHAAQQQSYNSMPSQPSQPYTQAVPVEQLVKDVANMGFPPERVRSVIMSMANSGQSIDLNTVLDRVMKGTY